MTSNNPVKWLLVGCCIFVYIWHPIILQNGSWLDVVFHSHMISNNPVKWLLVRYCIFINI